MKKWIPSASLLFGLSACPAVTAQFPVGDATAFALGVSLAPDAALPPPASELLVKLAGDQTSMPVAFAQLLTTIPDYRAGILFPPNVAAVIDIDATSIGNDIIPVDSQGTVAPESAVEYWVAISYSIRDREGPNPGLPGTPGGVVRDLASQGPIGGAVFGYYFEGSVGLDPGLVGNAFVEQKPADIGFTQNYDVDALDLFMPLVAQNSFLDSEEVFGFSGENFYFSLTRDSAMDPVVNNYLTSPAVGIPAADANSGATIYRMRWTEQGGNWSWSVPEVFRSAGELQINIAEDVDALAVDDTNATVLFSTRIEQSLPGVDPIAEPGLVATNNSRPQLMIEVSPGNVRPLMRQPGVDVRPGMETNAQDDIDGVCARDPEALQFSSWLGIAFDSGPASTSSLSLTRAISLNPVSPQLPCEFVGKIVMPSNVASRAVGALVRYRFYGSGPSGVFPPPFTPGAETFEFRIDAPLPSAQPLGAPVPNGAGYNQTGAMEVMVEIYGNVGGVAQIIDQTWRVGIRF